MRLFRNFTFGRPCSLRNGLLALVVAGCPVCLMADEGSFVAWDLVWEETFDGPVLDSSRWSYEKGLLRNHEAQAYTTNAANVRIENGVLVLEARKEKTPNARFRADGRQWFQQQKECDYSSGSIETRGKVTFPYGKTVVRARLPKMRGAWPAIWFIGCSNVSNHWPRCGEIDLMEHVGHRQGVVSGDFHWWDPAETNRGGHVSYGTHRLKDVDMDVFHDFTMIRDADRIVFYCDGRKYVDFPVASATLPDGSNAFRQDFFLKLNLALGGSWGGKCGIDDAALPQRFEIDSIRFYRPQRTDENVKPRDCAKEKRSARGTSYELQTGTVVIDDRTGALVDVRAKGATCASWRSGEDGLWALAFADGTRLCAADFATNGCSVVRQGDTFVYSHPKAQVEVRFVAKDRYVDLCGRVTGLADTAAVDFTLPGRLRFSPDAVSRFYMPQNGASGLGLALKPGFFTRRPPENPAGWKTMRKTGCNGYVRMFGGPVAMGAKDDPDVPVRMTPAAKALFPKAVQTAFEKRLAKRPHRVNRPCRKGQYDDVLLDSERGPFLSGSGLGGTGRLWRFGTIEEESSDTERLDFVAALVRGLAATNRTRRTLGVLRLANCSPQRGPMSGCSVDVCLAEMRTAAGQAGLALETIGSAEALAAALREDRHLAIVSPYGEALPVASVDDFAPSVDRVKAWVRRGGNWIETGGASFFAALVPTEYCSYEKPYPNLFLDFCALETQGGGLVALNGVRRRPKHEPWKCPQAFHVRPGTLGCGGDPAGGYVDHVFRLYAKGGAMETMPPVRLSFPGSVKDAVAEYGRVNQLTKPLAAKMDPAKLDTLKRALFLKIWGTAAECLALIDDLPQPTTFHTTGFLTGGFDKQYPDHLPTNPKFGTDAEHRALIDRLHARGHLYSPYTNPTWWCDHPRGPTFLAAGEEPLCRKADGSFYHEQYHANDGWTICFWHPAVQAANRKTVRQFTEDFPVDLLFQDQCGARRWRDDFNAASPSPTAYSEGLLSMNEEDARVVPLGTEDGWDRVANEQVGLFGVAWGAVPLRLVPTRHSRPLTKREEIPPDLWEIEPLAAWLMHDKVLFWMHDLGAFVTEPRVLAWMIATGYNLSESSWARTYAQKRAWFEHLAQVQRDICSRIAGQPLVSWRHDRTPMLARTDFNPCDGADDGIVVARWGGGIRCLVNLGDVPRTVEGFDLGPYGYRVEIPDEKDGSVHVYVDGGR